MGVHIDRVDRRSGRRQSFGWRLSSGTHDAVVYPFPNDAERIRFVVAVNVEVPAAKEAVDRGAVLEDVAALVAFYHWGATEEDREYAGEHLESEVGFDFEEVVGLDHFGEAYDFRLVEAQRRVEEQVPERAPAPSSSAVQGGGRDSWVVIGYDENEHESFWDVIPAASEEEARERFEGARGESAWIVDIRLKSDLVSIVGKLATRSLAEEEAAFREVESGGGLEEDEALEPEDRREPASGGAPVADALSILEPPVDRTGGGGRGRG